MKRIIKYISLLSFITLFFTACNNNSASALSCSEVTTDKLAIDGLIITASEEVEADDTITLDHCKVTGSIEQRVGVENINYAIKFELRLPNEWNEKFFHQFNGGSDGRVKDAYGVLPAQGRNDYALNRNYAVISSDAGHDMNAYADTEYVGYAGGSRFGLDPQARINYGYGAVLKLTPIAKQIIEKYYAKGIKYTYGVGSSNGGRHALVAASRAYEYFDDFFAAYPGYNLPKATIQHPHDIQQFNKIVSDVSNIDVQDVLDVVSNGIINTCDSLDGLEDGIVNDTATCQTKFDINSLVCTSSTTTDCITQAQADALASMHNGPKNSAGESLYNSWYYDPGLNGSNWAGWKTSRIITLGAPSLAQTFLTAPQADALGTTRTDFIEYLLNFSFDTDASKIYDTNSTFTESAISFMRPLDADNPKMTEFNKKGGKMIVIHGLSDPVFSAKDTTDWYDKLTANYDGDATSFVRYYRFPGMPHSSTSGITINKVDFLTALENWVEKGVAPTGLEATTNDDNPDVPDSLKGATRPVCDYPAIPVYTGSDSMSASSFTCREI